MVLGKRVLGSGKAPRGKTLNGTPMLALSRMDRMTRIVVFGMLAFAGSFLLGESYLPTPSYFWGLATGRFLLCLLLVTLPASDAGRFRPLLLILVASSLSVSTFATSLVFTRWALLTLLYLTLEVSIDALVMAQATEQEVPLELGVLAGARLSGLWFGLFAAYSNLSEELRTGLLAGVALLGMFVFWIVARENSADRFAPGRWKKRDDSARNILIAQLGLLFKPWTVVATLGLACYACLAGFQASAILPYPLLHPRGAGSWMTAILENLAVLSVGLLGAALFERLRLRNQLITAATFAWGLGLNYLLHQSGPPSWLWGLLLTSILLSSRAVLREGYSMDPVFRAAVVITVWTAGGLLGQFVASSIPTSTGRVVSFALALTATVLAMASWGRYAQVPKSVSTPLPPSRGDARFGDRTLDFEAVPQPKRKSRLAVSWRRRASYFLLHLPMYLITIAMITGGWKLGSYIFHNKVGWEKQLDDASRRFQTELFMSAFNRRLQEEMLATQRVPRDWNAFISQSFHSGGKPLTDIDLWGTPYRFANNREYVRVVSAGPDRLFETEDDLERSVNKPQGVR